MNNKFGKTFWFDLPASNPEDARSFYVGLFNWQFLLLQDSALPDYWVIQSGDELIGGMRKTPPEKRGNAVPILYFTVPDIEKTALRIRELGGKLVGNRINLGKGRGSFQWFRDREENLVALWAPAKEST